jgi:hypothetical protein
MDKGFLHQLLDTISSQTFEDFELVVSLDSRSPLPFNLSELPSSLLNKCRLKFLPSAETGISANTNFSINAASGKYIKIMFQDDLFADSESLYKIIRALDVSQRAWLISASDHFDERTKLRGPVFTPRLKKGLFRGINSISSPSVVALRSSAFLEFECSLSLMMDCEWYVRMVHNYGKPVILEEVTVINRLHSNQAQRLLDSTLADEIETLRKLHNKTGMRKTGCLCRK